MPWFARYEAYDVDSRTITSFVIGELLMFPEYARVLIRELEIRALLLQRFYKKVTHHLVGFNCFRQARIIPEGMWQRIEDDKARVNARAQKGAMKIGCAA